MKKIRENKRRKDGRSTDDRKKTRKRGGGNIEKCWIRGERCIWEVDNMGKNKLDGKIKRTGK